ncbi:serine hydrolase domain-containing protein [Streptosporangium sp. NPDC020072]|uniref:serine hydrolase domain-containing protein n=1 Tax=Streptosporangium sp. NPDC020072 TaxID=3154788 RepID=UPI0034131D9D
MDVLALPATALAGLLAELAREHHVPGAQLAVRHGGRTVSAGYGVETHGGEAAVTEATAFPLGSLTKPFTATLAAMLADDGDLTFDGPLPGGVEGVTLRGLLSHTSGLAADGDVRHPAVLRVGRAFSYSNLGYELVGRLVGQVTGMTWWEAVEELLLTPLGIEASYATGRRTGRRTATGHSVHPATGRVVPVAQEQETPGQAPSGALALSAADLVTLARLHLADPDLPVLLDRRTLHELREDQLAGIEIGPYGLADGWCLGWSAHHRDGLDWYGHDGTGEGTSCHLRFEPSQRTVVALTTNADTGLALWRDLTERLALHGIAPGDHRPLAGSGPPVAPPPGCTGTYVNGGSAFEVTSGGGGLRLRSAGPITCYRGGVFEIGEGHAGRFITLGGDIDLIQVSGRLARRAGSPGA